MATETKHPRRIDLSGLHCDECYEPLAGNLHDNNGHVIDRTLERIFCSPGCHSTYRNKEFMARIRMRQEKANAERLARISASVPISE